MALPGLSRISIIEPHSKQNTLEHVPSMPTGDVTQPGTDTQCAAFASFGVFVCDSRQKQRGIRAMKWQS